MISPKWFEVRGSHKKPLAGAKLIEPSRADERLEVTVRLRAKTPLPDPAELLGAGQEPIPQLTHEEFDALHGADPKDIAQIRKYAHDNHLAVVLESPSRRSVILSGTVADFSKAFNVSLNHYEYPGGTYRGRIGAVSVPAEFSESVEGVFGLDNRPVAKPHFKIRASHAAAAAARSFNPTEVAQIYNFPSTFDGTGQCIGIIELGGGYRPSDLSAYFHKLKLTKIPKVIPVSVDGARNSPVGDPNSADGEVGLDIEVAGAIAPGATIAVYFAPNDQSAKGFLDALTKAIHDTVNKPSVISISWGGPEQIPTSSFQTQFNQALQSAAMLGITVCIASGDNGAADVGPNEWDGSAIVDFPASSPFALACGATNLLVSGTTIQSESVWNQGQADTVNDSFGSCGGGISGVFGVPSYQTGLKIPPSLNPPGGKGRGVPDVTGVGDPATGFKVLVDGRSFVVGGTSAVAPLWAALIARINQKLKGRVGFINPQLYALQANAGALHDITQGNNRVSFATHNNVGYDAAPGWDPCGGLGSPNGAILANVLKVGASSSPKRD